MNKYYLKSNNDKEIKAFSKLECEFSIAKEIISYLNISKFNDYKIRFNSNHITNSIFFSLINVNV